MPAPAPHSLQLPLSTTIAVPAHARNDRPQDWSALRAPVRDILASEPFAGRAAIERVRVHAPRIGLGVLACVPARNEADRLCRTLDALERSLARLGEPAGILVLANNDTDGTADRAWAWAQAHDVPMAVCEARLDRAIADAGHARRLALDLGSLVTRADAVLLTTDADTRVARDWARRLVAPIRAGAGASAGMIDVEPAEFAALPECVHRIERDERALFREHARVWRILVPDEPVSLGLRVGGASLAVSREAYRRVGGMPALSSCEDRAMVARMLRHDERVAFDEDAVIRTSCRLDARAGGGMAGMLARRIEEDDPHCDEELRGAVEHALACLAWRWLRGPRAGGTEDADRDGRSLASALGVEPDALETLREVPHGEAWHRLERAMPRRRRLRAGDVRRELGEARSLRRALAAHVAARASWGDMLRLVTGHGGRQARRRMDR